MGVSSIGQRIAGSFGEIKANIKALAKRVNQMDAEDWNRLVDALIEAQEVIGTEADVAGSALSIEARLNRHAIPLDVSRFNILPTNDAATNTTNMLALRTFLRANPGMTVVFPPSDTPYTYLRPHWLYGVLDVKVSAYGAKFMNLSAGEVSSFDSCAFGGVASPFHTFGGTDLGHGEYVFGELFQTASAGDNSITLVTAAEAAEYASGNRVLLYGNCMQLDGGPVNPRYFEWKTVESVDEGTGVLAFTEKLLYSYNEDWFDFAAGKGAPRCLRLDRPDLTWGRSLEIHGGTFLKNPAWAASSSGRIFANGADRILFKDVTAESLITNQAGKVHLVNCRFKKAESDKIVDSIKYTGGEIGGEWNIEGDGGATGGGHNGGTGVNLIEFTGDIRITGFFESAARQTIVRGADISGFGSSIPTTVIAVNQLYPVSCFHVVSARVNAREASPTHVISGGGTHSVNVASVPDNTHVLIAYANETEVQSIVRPLQPGTVMRTLSGKRIVVKDAYDAGDGQHITIEGEQSVLAVNGDVYRFSNTKAIVVDDDVMVVGPRAQDLAFVYRDGAERIHAAPRNASSRRVTITEDQLRRPASGANPGPFKDIWVRGLITQIYVNVEKAYTGATVGGLIKVKELDSEPFADLVQVNPGVAGSRYATEFANGGAQSGDTVGTLSASRVQKIRIQCMDTGGNQLAYTDATELPLWTVILDIIATR